MGSSVSLDSLVDSIYIITIPKRRERIERIAQRMKIRPTIYKAVEKARLGPAEFKLVHPDYYKPRHHGRIACHLSHMGVLKDFLSTSHKTCLIFEDDIQTPSDLVKAATIFKGCMDTLPEAWDILYLGRCHDYCRLATSVSEYLIKSYPLCRHAYVVSRKGARKLLTYTIPMWHNGDQMYLKLIQAGRLSAYSSKEPLFFQQREELGSTLGNGSTNPPVCRWDSR